MTGPRWRAARCERGHHPTRPGSPGVPESESIMQPKIPGSLLLTAGQSEVPIRRARAAERRSLPPTHEDDPPAGERLERERARMLRRERATNTRLRALQALTDAA